MSNASLACVGGTHARGQSHNATMRKVAPMRCGTHAAHADLDPLPMIP
jgi:hypothetical protein